MRGQTRLDKAYELAYEATAKPLDDETRAAIDARWRQIHARYDFTDPTEFGRFAQAFLKRRFQRIDADQRRELLCGCGSELCNVLNGKLPVRLQPNWGWDDDPVTPRDARRWVNQHSHCRGMHDALSAWQAGRKQTLNILQEIRRIAHDGSIPDEPLSPAAAAVSKASVEAENIPGVSVDDQQDTSGTADSEEAEL